MVPPSVLHTWGGGIKTADTLYTLCTVYIHQSTRPTAEIIAPPLPVEKFKEIDKSVV